MSATSLLHCHAFSECAISFVPETHKYATESSEVQEKTKP